MALAGSGAIPTLFTIPPAAAATAPPVLLGSLTPSSATNGLGPIERDRDNGTAAANDGGPLSINGVAYARGVGTFANATIVYTFPRGRYARFVADVGIDDSACSRASMTF